MIRSVVNYVQKPPPIPAAYIDGFLYCAIALFGFFSTSFGTDEAAKYVAPITLFWLRTVTGAASAAFLALKMFRSTTFSQHVEERKNESPLAPSTTETANTGTTIEKSNK